MLSMSISIPSGGYAYNLQLISAIQRSGLFHETNLLIQYPEVGLTIQVVKIVQEMALKYGSVNF